MHLHRLHRQHIVDLNSTLAGSLGLWAVSCCIGYHCAPVVQPSCCYHRHCYGGRQKPRRHCSCYSHDECCYYIVLISHTANRELNMTVTTIAGIDQGSGTFNVRNAERHFLASSCSRASTSSSFDQIAQSQGSYSQKLRWRTPEMHHWRIIEVTRQTKVAVTLRMALCNGGEGLALPAANKCTSSKPIPANPTHPDPRQARTKLS